MTTALFSRTAAPLFSGLAALLLSVSMALAAPAIVVDAGSGRVLHAEDATLAWYPASITKLMTTYVVLSEIRAGRITFETPLTVSATATAVIPSKMGFKPGTEVTVDNALKMIMVKSANDMAVALAEGVGGSVENFAAMMNASASRLGMHDSYFVNPHGLPDERQRTSARDMAVLARALLTEFPQYKDYFGIGAIRFGKRIMRNTNGLIGRYPGADGMKTGFICASGFNVVATATRNGRTLITVVLGAHNATERTIRAAALFDKGFASTGWAGSTLEAMPVSYTSPPDMREAVCGRNRGTVGEDGDEMQTVEANAGLFNIFSPSPGLSKVMGDKPGTLGPREPTTPIDVYVGRAPGAKAAPAAVAATPPAARAFAPKEAEGPALSGSGPMVLQGAVRPPPRPVMKTQAPAKKTVQKTPPARKVSGN
ncbi:hypothetical protein BOQ54_02470 [Chelatococcus daeguensis]|uniref:Peptidase S11 D-alanyl-D-alanine carboxypeptidase A N-terminal domain-containing protein n=1 Tax=Chelatococcus daeguensis TaxID=444444 RepID=A0AAC9JMD4_9HYPH|nr:D-alanyl-D-alanine carboxypeptidase family protein [Chelatococcus daeguensis]APF36327.1 hypothetical protein BOQ54_02470 [Chelatococcus daeguensis]